MADQPLSWFHSQTQSAHCWPVVQSAWPIAVASILASCWLVAAPAPPLPRFWPNEPELEPEPPVPVPLVPASGCRAATSAVSWACGEIPDRAAAGSGRPPSAALTGSVGHLTSPRQ